MIKRWLVPLLLILALVQAGNILRALYPPAGITTSLILPLEVLAGSFWVIALVGTAVRVWRQHPRAIRRAVVLLMVFSFYVVARLVIFTRADYDRQRLPFLVILAAAIMVIVLVQEKKSGSE